MAFAVVILAVTAFIGYAVPEAKPSPPKRVLLENPGGPVVFEHARHEGYDLKCVQCHHASKVSTTEVGCGTCHPAEFDQHFVKNHIHWFEGRAACATCHHLEWGKPIFDHALHEEVAGGCDSCHHADKSIEPKEQRCSNCHAIPRSPMAAAKPVPSGTPPSLRDAVHARCRACHEDMFEKELTGCSNCHSRKNMPDVDWNNPTACRECHDKPRESLVPTRKDAFHKQCMGCHKKLGKGPYRDDKDVKDCGRCHLPTR
ncbi:cytochrome c3 family protein [Desulfovibrio sp. X2]|uniref:cytochrome c3 family protein n=1 Tax=Desulfovibrio sp. X2 TaxID=941449 RepID=UPI00068DCDE2|nr:cytochrome c3 family protein [Desulfovibrio sp. X2]